MPKLTHLHAEEPAVVGPRPQRHEGALESTGGGLLRGSDELLRQLAHCGDHRL